MKISACKRDSSFRTPYRFLIQPTDFVGETPLGDGPWSYHLTITDYATRSADVMARTD